MRPYVTSNSPVNIQSVVCDSRKQFQLFLAHLSEQERKSEPRYVLDNSLVGYTEPYSPGVYHPAPFTLAQMIGD